MVDMETNDPRSQTPSFDDDHTLNLGAPHNQASPLNQSSPPNQDRPLHESGPLSQDADGPTGPPGRPDFAPHQQGYSSDPASTGMYGGQPPQAYQLPPVLPSTAQPATGRRRRGGAAIAAVALAAVVGAGAGIGSYAFLDQGAIGSSPISVTTVPARQTTQLNGTVAAAAAKIDPSVVTIAVQNSQSGDIGTGIIVDEEGHILTNQHVVAAAAQGGQITVTLADGRTATATLVGQSTANDLAVIKINDSAKINVSDLKPATFATSSSIKVGQAVVAVGAPLGLSETVTSGVVSNTARPVRSGLTDNAVYLAVQTDAAINPGNSGGPLVDLNGSVIGINSAIASTGSQGGNIGIGFSIPADVASRVTTDLIAHGDSPEAALGVTVSNGDATQGAASGVTLRSVMAGSAADKAGLRAGDSVTRVNDFTVTQADGLIAVTRFYAPGTQVTINYLRDGTQHTVKVTLGTQQP